MKSAPGLIAQNYLMFQSVKGTKPFKTKKKSGGRLGLRRLKEKRREEMVIEGTPQKLELSDVDVEFSLPKLKQRRSGQMEGTGGAAVKAKRTIRLAMFVWLVYVIADQTGRDLLRSI